MKRTPKYARIVQRTPENREILYEDKWIQITKPIHSIPSDTVYQFLIWTKNTVSGNWIYKATVTDWEPFESLPENNI